MNMQVLTTKTLPSTKELIEILKREFSDKYTYEPFGLGANKSILVRKSYFVGVQILKNDNVLNIDGISPSVSASLFRVLLEVLANLFIIFSSSSYKRLEKEITVFIKKKYN